MTTDPLAIFQNKTILITGGTGSFGQALARRLLSDSRCSKVIILSRDEWKQSEMRESAPIFKHPNIRYFLGDVRDAGRLARAFHEVNFIVHAAALKQVPAAEYNPTEFIKTNIIGGMNVIDQAISCGVEKVIALSTDKAVNPINLYGATKLCSDRLFIAGNSYVGKRKSPQLAVVRYGNVLGSRGSVIPFWQKLISSGVTTLPITDKRMTRFWISINQAVDFVIASFNRMRGGEIFVPKIPSMYIKDLATAIAPHLAHSYVGIRAGEKLHELMIGIDDSRHTLEYEDHYMIIPDTIPTTSEAFKHFTHGRIGKALPEEFSYVSQTNTQWLSLEDLQQQLPAIIKS